MLSPPRSASIAAAFACALSAAPAWSADTSSVSTLPVPAAAGAPWTSSELAALQGDLDAMLQSSPTLRGAHAGLLAVETGSGRALYARLPDDAFLPASNFKLLTGSAALARLGPRFTFKTSVALEGSTLVLIGGGDALLRTADLDQAAAAVAAAGAGPVEELAADESLYDGVRYGPGWSWEDFPFYYAPPMSAVCLEDNVVHATLTPGLAGAPASLDLAPDLAPPVRLAVANRVVTGASGSEDTVDVAREGERIVFTGSLPQGAKPEVVDAAVPDPARYALGAFATALARHGVVLAPGLALAVRDRPPAVPYLPLWTHESAPLATYLADFWYPSDNLIGEMLLKALGVAHSGVPGTAANGIALEVDWLRSLGVDPKRLDISDGSGLSVYDRISPRILVRILQADWNGSDRRSVIDALPVAGVRGSLREDFKSTPAQGRVFAKTGTLRHTRAISGYLRPLRHGAITFSFMVDDWLGQDADMDALRARLLSRLIRG